MKVRVFLSHTKKMTYDHPMKDLIRMSWELQKEDKILLFTGFRDAYGKEIFDGDILIGQESEKSYEQVFFNEKTGQWCLDNSYNQDCSISEPLYEALDDFKYTIEGNVYEHPELLK